MYPDSSDNDSLLKEVGRRRRRSATLCALSGEELIEDGSGLESKLGEDGVFFEAAVVAQPEVEKRAGEDEQTETLIEADEGEVLEAEAASLAVDRSEEVEDSIEAGSEAPSEVAEPEALAGGDISLQEADAVLENAVEDVANEEGSAPVGVYGEATDDIEAQVEEIARILDFESLPKTKPKRVNAQVERASDGSGASGQVEEKVAKKRGTRRAKKRVSLLDDYFKDL